MFAAITERQEFEIRYLELELGLDFIEIHPWESGLNTLNSCYQITLSPQPQPQNDGSDQSTTLPVVLALIFSHTERYPREPPLLNVKSIRGIKRSDLKALKQKLEQEAASEYLYFEMILPLVSLAKEWLSERYGQDVDADVDVDVDAGAGADADVANKGMFRCLPFTCFLFRT